MKKRTLLLLIITFAISSALFSASLEREGNIFYLKADSLFKQKDFPQAANFYQKALEKYRLAEKKENAVVDEHIREILLDKYWKAHYFAKNYDKAIEILKSNLSLKGVKPKTITKIEKIIVTIYKKKKDYNSAIQFLLERENIKPASWKEKKLGLLYYKLKDYQNALKWYKKVKERKVTTDIVKKIANCYLKLKDYKSAVETYELYLKSLDKSQSGSNTKLKTTYRNMATLYYNINNINKAIYYWEKVLSISFDADVASNLMIKYWKFFAFRFEFGRTIK